VIQPFSGTRLCHGGKGYGVRYLELKWKSLPSDDTAQKQAHCGQHHAKGE
jgi:hypothetical protein